MKSKDWADLAEMVDMAMLDARGDLISAKVFRGLLRAKAENVAVGESLDKPKDPLQTSSLDERWQRKFRELQGLRNCNCESLDIEQSKARFFCNHSSLGPSCTCKCHPENR